MEDVIAVLLAGGVGSRLLPLTDGRAKPAVPFGGKYRIVDFTLTNCLHSGIRRILVLTQYKSHSLQTHLRDGWSIFNPELGGYVTVVPPQMQQGDGWYQGTANAIYQSLWLLARSRAKYVIVLSGDHIYRMDYANMLRKHRRAKADFTIACMEVPREEASAFGVMSVDEENRIASFDEKPENPKPCPSDPSKSLASMGVYIFTKDVLLDVLEQDAQNPESSHDIGKDIIPNLIKEKRGLAYSFSKNSGRVSPDAYWRDVGTIDSYYQANMELLKPIPPMNLYQEDWAIRSYEPQLPPARSVCSENGEECQFSNSIISNGVLLLGGAVSNSILSPNVIVKCGSTVSNSILFDNVKVGKGCRIHKCIIDKHVEIPDGTQIGIDHKEDAKRFKISEKGVVVIPKYYQFT